MNTTTTNANELYREAFEGAALDAALVERRENRIAAQAEWSERCEAEQKRRQPRARKKFKPLDEEWLAELRRELFAKYDVDAVENRCTELRDEREKRLAELAPQVEIGPAGDAAVRVKTSSTSTYRSQTQPHHYAKAALKPLEAVLTAHGVPCHIRLVGYDYELWAECPAWMADAAERTLTWETISKAIGRTTNPKVLFPFLPYELLDQHFGGA